MTPPDIHAALENLAGHRPIFRSEADSKLALAGRSR